jgi:hypothetical protein
MPRVVFTFDDSSLESLNAVKERGDFSSLATAVRDSVQLAEVLQDQVADGFTEVVVRNPRTNQERTLVIPSFRKLARAAKSGA